ncbi:hypothetical protein [Thalassospira lucentensis]|nr:hypothetical protein [Thalassospira lucentensis]
MAYFRMTRDAYIENYLPANVTKIASKASQAVAYAYATKEGTPCAAFFVGRKTRPSAHNSFKSDWDREESIKKHFEREDRKAAEKAAHRREISEQGRGVELGHVLVSSWGYDQTNVDFYQVTKLIGNTMAEIRKIGSIDASRSTDVSMTGHVMPDINQFVGDPIRVKISNGQCRLTSYSSASLWNGLPKYTSSYA